jgi:ribosomal protein L7/L12
MAKTTANLSRQQVEELRRLVEGGKKIEAVKRFREITGVGLKESLSMVEHMFEHGGHGAPMLDHLAGVAGQAMAPPTEKSLAKAEEAALRALRERNNVIEAIKEYRKHTGVGLKEARDAIVGVTLAHLSDGRVNLKTARSVADMLRDGRKEEAVTQLMMMTGYEDSEARSLISKVQKAGGAGCPIGCVLALAFLVFFIALGIFVAVQKP